MATVARIKLAILVLENVTMFAEDMTITPE
jgi:hypothetical protein